MCYGILSNCSKLFYTNYSHYQNNFEQLLIAAKVNNYFQIQNFIYNFFHLIVIFLSHDCNRYFSDVVFPFKNSQIF